MREKFPFVAKIDKALLAPIVLVLIELSIGFLQAPWDVDAHHDGIVYGAAVAASEGLMPNSEYFEQYGPLAPSIQGLFLKLTSPSLYNLRIFTVLTVTLIALLIYFSATKVLGVYGGFAVATLWTISSPGLHATMLPWSSFYSTLFLIAAIYSIRKFSPRSYFGIDLGYSVAAGLMVLASLCRINVLGTIGALALVLVVKREWRALCASIVGFSVVFALFNIIGAFNGFLRDFYYQCIVWAFGTYSTNGAEDTKGHIVNTLMYLTIPFFGLMVVFLSKFLKAKLGIFVVLTLLFATLLTQNLETDHKSYANPIFLFLFISEHTHYMFSYFGIFISIFASVYYLKRKSITLEKLSIAVIGGSVLFQLYPSPDPLHLWWVAPVALITFFSIVSDDMKITFLQINRRGFSHLASILVIVMGVMLYQQAQIPRFSFVSSTLQNMQGTSAEDKDLDVTLKLIEGQSIKGEVGFDCRDGIYAAAGSSYLPKGKDFVSWSPKPDFRLFDLKYIYVCDSKLNAKQYPLRGNWRVLFEVPTSKGFNFLLQRTPDR
jgi:hypothetical protein